jgi:23S rRNA pseudouridine2605 synthase
MERLQKIMAQAGVASRRHCEDMIRQGLVKINGTVRSKLPIMADPQHDVIFVSGRKLKFEQKVYFLLHKPKKVVCTNYDPDERKKTVDLLAGVRQRVYSVGRLDADSQGLVLMTNDGELANQLTHPRYGVPKTYVVEIDGQFSSDDIEKLKKGFYIAKDGRASMDRIKILRHGHQQSMLEITIREGRNRQIRRMLARLGYSVRKLTRVSFGPLTLRGLGPGHYRPLTLKEIRTLRKLAENQDI